MIKVYEYKTCSTCVKALKFLDAKGVKYERIPIVDEPPSLHELRRMLSYVQLEGGTFKSLFNTSGQLYRELSIAQKIKDGLTEDDALELLSKNGKLIKRPFLLAKSTGTVGFKEDVWKALLPRL